MVHLSQAQGEFVLPDQVPEHVLFISGGSGITPVMSMLRSLQRRTHRGRVTFLHYAQSPEHQIFADELDEIRRSGHGIDVHLLHPELGDPNLSPAFLERLVPGYRDVADLGLRPGAADRGGAGGVRRLRRSASSTSSRRAPPAPRPTATSPSPGPAGGAEHRRDRSWSRPRRSG